MSGSSSGGREPPSTICRNDAGSIRRSAVGTSDTSVAPRRGRCRRPTQRRTRRARPAECRSPAARVTTDKPPTCDSGRQASHTSSVGRRRAEQMWPCADACDRVVRQDDALAARRWCRWWRRRAHRRRRRRGRRATRSVRVDQPVGCDGIEHAWRARGGRRRSNGNAASPSSQVRRSASTNARRREDRSQQGAPR